MFDLTLSIAKHFFVVPFSGGASNGYCTSIFSVVHTVFSRWESRIGSEGFNENNIYIYIYIYIYYFFNNIKKKECSTM